MKEGREGEFLIGNNVGKVNGWVPASAVLGKVVAVEGERGGCPIRVFVGSSGSQRN